MLYPLQLVLFGLVNLVDFVVLLFQFRFSALFQPFNLGTLFLYYLHPFLIFLTFLFFNLLALCVKSLFDGLVNLLRCRPARAFLFLRIGVLRPCFLDGLCILVWDISVLIGRLVGLYDLWGLCIDGNGILWPVEIQIVGYVLWGEVLLRLSAGLGIFGLCDHPYRANQLVLVAVFDLQILFSQFGRIVSEYASIP